MVKVKFKRLHENAVLPKKANAHDAGFDITAVTEEIDPLSRIVTYKLGWAIEIPEGHVGFLFPRSSICNKSIALTNSVGVIDSGYRGELMAKFRPTIVAGAKKYEVGDRVIQLIVMPIPQIAIEEVSELSNTDRGTGSFGSSGK